MGKQGRLEAANSELRSRAWFHVSGVIALILAAACGRTNGSDADAEPKTSEGPPGTSVPEDTPAPEGTPEPTGIPEPTAVPAEWSAMTEGMCNGAGWCWVEPLPFGDVIRDVHGTRDGETVYAVGIGGTVIEIGSKGLRYHDTGSVMALDHVDVTAPHEVWAGGPEGLLRRSRAGWSAEAVGQVSAITHTGDGRTWAIVDSRLRRRDDAGWVDVQIEGAERFADLVPGAGQRDLWALSYSFEGRYHNHALHHFDGEGWSTVAGAPTRDYDLMELVRAGSEVYAYRGAGLWRASTGWENLGGPVGADAGWGVSDGTVFLATFASFVRFDANGVTQLAGEAPAATWGTSARDLWLAPSGGGLIHVDATRLAAGSEEQLRPRRAWADNEWGTVPAELWADSTAAWGSAPNDVWRASLEHFDGSSWTDRGPAVVPRKVAVDIDGSDPDNVWFALADVWSPAGPPSMLRWDGEALREQALPPEWAGFRVTHVRSFAPDDTWVTAQSIDRARIGHFGGTGWTVMIEMEAKPLHEHWGSIEGLGPRDVWVAAADAVHHFADRIHSVALVPASGERVLSLAVDPKDVWVVSDQFAYVYDPATSTFRSEVYARGRLDSIGLTPDFVWIHSGRRVLRRAR